MSDDIEVIGPASPKQEMMLSVDCDWAIIGGAMGSGKSYVSLLYPLKYADDPYFRGIIFRKTTGELTAQGGLWETACELYQRIYGDVLKIHKKELKITFPSGASLKFSHMEQESNRFAHQGAQYTFILWDEATHFSKVVIEYLGTRLRSARAKHKLQVICTCNPDPDWFGLDMIRPYLYEDGTPNPEKDGLVRYYVVDNGVYIWADDRETLEQRYGYGDESGIKSFTFISATCYDNPPLLKNQPSYISELKAKPWVDVQRYLYGNWLVRPSSSGYWKREWCQEITEYPRADEIRKIVRAWDFASTLASPVSPDPDYTVGVKMALLKNGQYIILDVIRFRARYGDVLQRVRKVGLDDGREVDIIIPQDPGAAGKAASSMAVKGLIEDGFYARTKNTSKGKIERFRPFAAASENGLVQILKSCATCLENGITGDNNFFYKELESFDGGRKGHDDCVDSTADAFYMLAQSHVLPSFSLPDMKQDNPFNI